MLDAVYDVLEVSFQDKCLFYRDITYQKYNGSKDVVPLVMIHMTGIYLFFDKKQKQRDTMNTAVELMRFVQKNIDCKPSAIICFDVVLQEGAEPTIEAEEIDMVINRVKYVDDLIEELKILLQTRPIALNSDEITNAGLKISSTMRKNNEIMTAKDGTRYIFKKQKWHELSELDGERYFYEYMLGGVLGIPYFKQGYIMKGILHLITLGGLGIGWFVDCLYMIFGIGKDPDGYYIEPLENKGIKLILLVIMAVIVFIAIFVLLQLIFTGIENITKILQEIIMQGGQ